MEPNNENRVIDITAMEVHKVVSPPHRSTFQKLKNRLKETFFPDDPLRQFKGQPLKQKLILGAQYVFPILEWGPNYSFKLFKSDIISGLTIASLAIPQVGSFFVSGLTLFLILSFKVMVISSFTIATLLTLSFFSFWQGISYAKLANLPPIVGLCTCFHCHRAIIFSFFNLLGVLK